MKVFKVPFDVKREEKIFGGYLSIRQVLYLALGLTSFCSLLLPIQIVIQIITISLSIIFFLLCAFLKIDDIYFDKLLLEYFKYIFRKRIYTYERENL